MKLIVGIGNPGSKYAHTRHNVGFDIVDFLAHKHHVKFSQKPKFNAEIAELTYKGNKALIVKPLTYVNLSGIAVLKIVEYFNIKLADIMVIYDDVDLIVGKMRMRELGGHGGHNGMRDIINHLKSNKFKRIRIGIDKPPLGRAMNDHVLSRFSKEEEKRLVNIFKLSAEAVEEFIEGVFYTDIMTKFNTISNGIDDEK